MSKVRREELRLVADQAIEWLQRPATTTPKEQEERLNWLLESPLHMREALAAMAWTEELCQFLDPDRRVDVDALIVQALNNVISMAGSRPTDVPAIDAEGALINTEEEIEVVDSVAQSRNPGS